MLSRINVRKLKERHSRPGWPTPSPTLGHLLLLIGSLETLVMRLWLHVGLDNTQVVWFLEGAQ